MGNSHHTLDIYTALLSGLQMSGKRVSTGIHHPAVSWEHRSYPAGRPPDAGSR